MVCAEIFANIQFDTDKTVVKPQYHEMLDRVVALMNKTQCRVQLSGYTEQRASETNILARRRVEAVQHYLIRAGLNAPNRILIDYSGVVKPTGNESQPGLFRSRRVELKLVP